MKRLYVFAFLAGLYAWVYLPSAWLPGWLAPVLSIEIGIVILGIVLTARRERTDGQAEPPPYHRRVMRPRRAASRGLRPSYRSSKVLFIRRGHAGGTRRALWLRAVRASLGIGHAE